MALGAGGRVRPAREQDEQEEDERAAARGGETLQRRPRGSREPHRPGIGDPIGYHEAMVSLTERAALRVRELAAGEPAATVLRVAVEGGGCSGFQYALGFDNGLEADDVEVESHGVRVVVDRVSLPYVNGSTIDYVDGLLNAGFQFDNPNVAATCGCNASFQAKPGIEGPYSPKPGNGGCAL